MISSDDMFGTVEACCCEVALIFDLHIPELMLGFLFFYFFTIENDKVSILKSAERELCF